MPNDRVSLGRDEREGNLRGIGGLAFARVGSLLCLSKRNRLGVLCAAVALFCCLPGKGIVNGANVTFFESDSPYIYKIDENNPQLIDARGGGTVTIQSGARLEVTPTNAILGRHYQIVAVNNLAQFDSRDNLNLPVHFELANLEHVFETVFHDGTNTKYSAGYWLAWKKFADTIAPYGTPNALRAAVGMDEIVYAELLEHHSIYFGLAELEPSVLADAFAQLHGEVFAANQDAVVLMQRRFRGLLPTGQDFVLKSGVVGGKPKLWNRWGTVVGTMSTRSKINSYSGYDLNTVGFAAGIDRSIIPNMLLGVAVGYDNAYTSFDLIRSKSKTDALRSMVYVSWFNGSFFIDSYGGYTKNWHQTTRNINIGDASVNGGVDMFSATAKGKYDDDLVSTGIDFGRVLWLNPVTTVAPGVGLHYARLIAPAVTETGGGYTNLHVAGGHYQSFQASLGAKANRIFALSDNVVLTPEVRGYYVREFADDEAIVRTSFADPSVRHITFNAHSGKWGPDSGRLGMGLGVLVSDWMTFRLDFDREIYNHADVDVFSTTLGVTW